MKKIALIFIAVLALMTARTTFAYSGPFTPTGPSNCSISGSPGFVVWDYTSGSQVAWNGGGLNCSGLMSTPSTFGLTYDGTYNIMYWTSGITSSDCDLWPDCFIPSHNVGWTHFNNQDGAITVTVQGGVVIDVDTSTHFLGFELSTTTQTFRVTGYINSSDQNVHLGFNVSTPLYSQWDNEDLIATTSGFFDQSFIYQNFGTSTIDQFTFTGTLYTPSTDPFYASVPPTIYDTISTTTTSNGLGVTSLPSPHDIDVAVAENCNPFSSFFSTSACVTYLFFPNPTEVANNTNTVRNTLLTKAPLGYVTRVYNIITSTGTTTIPQISYTWGTDGGPLDGKTWTLDVDNYMVQASTLTSQMVSNTDHKTAWEIFNPFINMFLAIVVLYGILSDIMGLKLINHRK